MHDITLFGAHLSPYVRKVRLVLASKSIPYQHVNVVPFQNNHPEEFTANSPLGKIPLLRVGGEYLADSSVICQYLEQAVPEPALLPSDAMTMARALWFEEYADSHMTAVIAGHLFVEKILARPLFKREPNEAEITKAIEEEIPAIFDYLSAELHGMYLTGDAVTLGDLAVAGLLIAMRHCDVGCDANRWPELAQYFDRLLALPAVSTVAAEETMILKMMAGLS